jgi:CheY-like chemotaxis protein
VSLYKNLRKVLLAEDDAPVRELFTLILEQLGLEVVAVPDGSEAVSALKQSDQFDLLMTDFKMPKMNGVELLKWCRENGLHFPVILVTADANLRSEEILALGDCCASLLPKPFELDRLAAVIGAADAREHHRDCVHLRAPRHPG